MRPIDGKVRKAAELERRSERFYRKKVRIGLEGSASVGPVSLANRRTFLSGLVSSFLASLNRNRRNGSHLSYLLSLLI